MIEQLKLTAQGKHVDCTSCIHLCPQKHF